MALSLICEPMTRLVGIYVSCDHLAISLMMALRCKNDFLLEVATGVVDGIADPALVTLAMVLVTSLMNSDGDIYAG